MTGVKSHMAVRTEEPATTSVTTAGVTAPTTRIMTTRERDVNCIKPSPFIFRLQ